MKSTITGKKYNITKRQFNKIAKLAEQVDAIREQFPEYMDEYATDAELYAGGTIYQNLDAIRATFDCILQEFD